MSTMTCQRGIKYPQYLQVFYDGRPVHPDEWRYDAANNRVYFGPPPDGGVLVEIAYYYQANSLIIWRKSWQKK